MGNKICLIVLVLFCWITLFFHLPVNAYEFQQYQGFELKITGNISENYSNNTTFEKDEDRKVEDFRTMANLGMNLNYQGKRSSLGFSGTANRRIEFDDSDISNFSERMNFSFNYEFSEYDMINITNNFTHTQEPDSFDNSNFVECRERFKNSGLSHEEIDSRCNQFAEEFGRFRGRFDSYNNTARFAYKKSISKHININTNYSYAEHWSPEENARDSHQNSLGANVNYSYSPDTSFSLFYNYRISEYESGNDTSLQSISAGINQNITRRVYFNGRIGRDFVSEGSERISGSASLNAAMDEETTGTLSYSQGIQISPHEEDTFGNWRISASLTRQLLEDFNGSLVAFYGEGEFASSDITETLMGASATLSYNFWTGKRGSSVNGRAGYTYSDVDTTDENKGYQRSSVIASLTLAF